MIFMSFHLTLAMLHKKMFNPALNAFAGAADFQLKVYINFRLSEIFDFFFRFFLRRPKKKQFHVFCLCFHKSTSFNIFLIGRE